MCFIYEILDSEQQKVYSVEYELMQYANHNFVQVFELNGETCLDGVIEYMRCKDCGYVLSERTFYDHEAHQKSIYIEEACGQPVYVLQQCECGESTLNAYIDGHMSFINEEIVIPRKY